MASISRFLRLGAFLSIPKGTKSLGTEKDVDWNTQGISFDEANEALKKGWNVALICGVNNIICVDSDHEDLYKYLQKNLPLTTCEMTASGNYHHFYKLKGDYGNPTIKRGGDHLGEIRVKRHGVIIAPSDEVPKKPEGSGYGSYKLMNEVELPEVTPEILNKLCKHFMGDTPSPGNLRLTPDDRKLIDSDSEVKKLFEGDWKDFPSRSEAELSLVGKLVARGCDKEDVFRIMSSCKIGKWNKANIGYRNLTYNKAVPFVTQEKKVELGEDFSDIDDSCYTYKDLKSYEPQPVDWLIENQIPRGVVAIIAGKRSSWKTWGVLFQAYGIASGKPVFGDAVPKRGKVVVWEEESGKGTIASRGEMVRDGLGISDDEDLEVMFISLSGVKLDGKDNRLDYLLDKIREFKPDIIFVDCFQRVVRLDVDTENSAISAVFTDILRPLIKELGCTIVLVHHMRKSLTGKKGADLMDEIRGGSELINYPRSVMVFELPRQDKGESTIVYFHVVKMSNAEIPESKSLSFRVEDGAMLVENMGRPEDVFTAEATCALALKEWLVESQKINFKTYEAKDAVEDGKSIVQSALKLLITQGFIERVKIGHYQVVGKVQSKLDLNKDNPEGIKSHPVVEADKKKRGVK